MPSADLVLDLVAQREANESELPAGIYQCIEVGAPEQAVTMPVEASVRSNTAGYYEGKVAVAESETLQRAC